MKRQKPVQPPLGIVRPTARRTSWRGPSEVRAVRMRRLAVEQREHEKIMAEAEREVFPDYHAEIQAILSATLLKRMPDHRTR